MRSRLMCIVVVLIVAGLFTGGCTKHWSKPSGTYEQFTKDSYDCAQKHTWEGDLKKDMYRACLKERGYLFVISGDWEGVRD